jgi:hypothetical protein
MSMELKSRWRSALSATAGASALLFTFACGGAARDLNGAAAQSIAANQAGAPVLVGCEPHQRTLVRSVVINGAAVSQVECVAVGQAAAYAPNGTAAPTPVSYGAPGYSVSQPARPVYSEMGDAQIVPAARHPSAGAARPVRTSQVIYDERPVKRGRSVKKSAIIIGSSAGVGAGVGAAVGGKKGALIGAAIGGGSAAVWDQVTRR